MQRMMRRTSGRIPAVFILGIALLSARQATAQTDPDASACDNPARPVTPPEKKLYEDSYALFQRMAPAATAGWTAEDSTKAKTITFICGPAIMTRFSFSRGYNRPYDQARSDAAQSQVNAAAARADARRDANAAKIADIERRIEALAKQAATLAEQQKYAEMAAISQQMDKLGEERQALSEDPELAATADAAGAAVSKDTTAQFTLVVGEPSADYRSFGPMPSAVGRGYRQDGVDKQGNPEADLVVVLPPIAGTTGQTVVTITGDPARAEALFNATNFR